MALLTGDEVIEIAIRLEVRGEEFYRASASSATSASVQLLFTDLAEQEVHHRLAFERMGRDVVELALSPDQWDEFQAYTNALLDQSFFSRRQGAISELAQALDEREAVESALAFEKETLLFFHELRDAVRGAGKAVIGRIIDEERRHIQRLATALAAT